MRGKERRIQDEIETNRRILLEYGIPFGNIPYRKIWEKPDEGFSDEISEEAADIVEMEAKEGRFGAFVIRRGMDESDNVEVWSWAD